MQEQHHLTHSCDCASASAQCQLVRLSCLHILFALLRFSCHTCRVDTVKDCLELPQHVHRTLLSLAFCAADGTTVYASNADNEARWYIDARQHAMGPGYEDVFHVRCPIASGIGNTSDEVRPKNRLQPAFSKHNAFPTGH